MTDKDKDRIKSAIRHIKSSVDVDTWAMEIAVNAMLRMLNADGDLVSRREGIDHFRLIVDATNKDSEYNMGFVDGLEFCISHLSTMPSTQHEPREVVPHRNYQYLSDYWCGCGWHLGKKGDVKYCPDCGRKVVWND